MFLTRRDIPGLAGTGTVDETMAPDLREADVQAGDVLAREVLAGGSLATGVPARGGPAAGAGSTPRRRRGASGRAAWVAGFAAAGVALFLCYLRTSRTVPVNSDGAANALQAWDMLHGNLLLHGWWLSDVSFYTTELPQYMLVEAVRGLGPDVVHVAAAISYALLVLLASLVARGRATGGEALARVLITAGIMLAPQLGNASYTLLLSPDHLGTLVPLLLIWLVIDRAPARWYVPVAVGLLLAWALVADPLVLPLGVAPLVIVCVVRVGRAVVRGGAARGPAARISSRYQMRLAGAALASVPAAWLAARLISDFGGYHLSAVPVGFSTAFRENAVLAYQGVLELFGAYVTGQQPGPGLLFAAVHVLGLALAGWALCIALGRFFRWDDLLVPAFAVAILLNLAAYVLSTLPGNIRSTREIAGVLPFGAVLAGRLLGSRAMKARRLARPALLSAGAAWLLCSAAALGYDAVQPPVPAGNQALATWLVRHHLFDGLGGYWQADSLRLDSRARIVISAVNVHDGKLVLGGTWEANRSWFNPALHYSNFVATSRRAPYDQGGLIERAAWRTFGRPAIVYRLGPETVLVWNKNLLAILGHAAASQAHP